MTEKLARINTIKRGNTIQSARTGQSTTKVQGYNIITKARTNGILSSQKKTDGWGVRADSGKQTTKRTK